MSTDSNVRVHRIGDGSTTQFTFDFSYIRGAYVFVQVDSRPTHFEFVTANTIRIEPAPAAGADVLIYRWTPALQPAYQFELGAPFLPRYVDENFQQILDVLNERGTGTGGDGGGGGGTVSWRYARRMVPDDLLPLDVNDVPASGGFTFRAQDELNEMFSGGDRLGELPTITSNDWAKIMFMPPTEAATGAVAPYVPWMQPVGWHQHRRIVPMDIRTVISGSPISVPLFRPIETGVSGIHVFEYIGTEPLYGVLEGSMELLKRDALTEDYEEGFNNIQFRLDCINPPLHENGANFGSQMLAVSYGAAMPPRFKLSYEGFQDPPGPPTPELVALAQEGLDLMAGKDTFRGFIPEGSTEEALSGSDDKGPVGEEVRTTDWMDLYADGYVRPPSNHVFFVDVTGQARQLRVQSKDADGNITYVDRSSRELYSARSFVALPIDAVAFRVNYSRRGDSPSNIRVLSMHPRHSARIDPLKGYFGYRSFNVMRDVVFYPGVRYYFSFRTTAEGGSNQERGYRILGGGFSLTFDAGRIRKHMAQRLYRESQDGDD